jgi:beta-alanine degradation protein BauB
MGEQMTTKDIGKLNLGPIGDRIMYENEMVRVWDFVVEPGKSKGWHRHELPYVIIPMTDGDIELESALTGDIERPKGKIGEPIWRDAGEVHDLRNVGNGTYRNILIEIKPR